MKPLIVFLFVLGIGQAMAYEPGTVTGPSIATQYGIPVWSNTTGTLLSDPPTPVWATYTGTFNAATANIGPLPLSAMFGGGLGRVAIALTGAIDIPSSDPGDSSNLANMGLAGYCRTTSKQCVGTFGGAMVNANITNSANGVWGWNSIVSNSPTMYPSGNVGFDFQNAFGAEFDFNIVPKTGGAAPAGNVLAVDIGGGSTIAPTGSTVGVQIGALGTGIPWQNGFYTFDGAVTTFANVGAAGTGNNVGSQPISLRSRTSGGTNQSSQLETDANSDLVYNVPATAAHFFQANGKSSFAALSGGSPPANYIEVVSSAAGASPLITAAGSDTNVGITIQPKALGILNFQVSNGLAINGTVAANCASGVTAATVVVSNGIVTHC